ncbi:MAG: PilZ domain-containing protein [Candidatus Eremiobacteraeota bacterium]|nr:PilZ domain-containing protein [Candidatus Eremiobacteraeota bacterium]
MLSLFSPRNPSTQARLVSRNGREGLVETSERLSWDGPTELLGALVKVHAHRRLPSGWLSSVSLIEGDFQVPVEPPGDYPLRGEPRLPISLRARSQWFPNFEALTVDLTAQGVQLLTHAPLKPGDELALSLDLDNGLEPVELLGTVCWSRMTAPFKAGLSLQPQDARQQARLHSYLETVTQDAFATPMAAVLEPDRLRQAAYLQTFYREGRQVWLSLYTHEEAMHYEFDSVCSLSHNPEQHWVHSLERLTEGAAVSEAQARSELESPIACHRFLSLDGEVVLEIIGPDPVVTVSTRPQTRLAG